MATLESSGKIEAGSSGPSATLWVDVPLGTWTSTIAPHQDPAVVVDGDAGLRRQRRGGRGRRSPALPRLPAFCSSFHGLHGHAARDPPHDDVGRQDGDGPVDPSHRIVGHAEGDVESHQDRRGEGDAIGDPGCTPGTLGAALGADSHPTRGRRRGARSPTQGTSGSPPRDSMAELRGGGGAAEIAGADVVLHDGVHHRGRAPGRRGRARPGGRASSRRRGSGPTDWRRPCPRCRARCRAPPRRWRPWCRCWRPARGRARRPGRRPRRSGCRRTCWSSP